MATILVIEDSASERAAIRKVLEASGDFDRILEASDGIVGLRRLLADDIDLVLCDLEMPGLDGEKLLRARACRTRSTEIPFLYLTATRDFERRARLLRAGASDLIGKPFHAAELLARLQMHLKVKRLQDELLEKNAMLSRLSSSDPVTGLRTRRFVTDMLALEFLRSGRYGTPLCVLMADLDHFKDVNDRHGHPAGDAVLAGVGELLNGLLRASDVAGRYGGEEMLVLLPQTGAEGGLATAERFRSAVEAAHFEIASGERLTITVSIGVAAHQSGLQSPSELVMAADDALYQAKAEGRNRVVLAQPAPVSE